MAPILALRTDGPRAARLPRFVPLSHLTAMGQDLAAVGKRAVDLLLALIAEPDADLQRIRIEPPFQAP